MQDSPAESPQALDRITFLYPTGSHRAVKQVTRLPNGRVHIEGYGKAATFTWRECPVNDIDDLYQALQDAGRRNCFAIRGAVINRSKSRINRRYQEHADKAPPDIEPRSRYVLPLDFDATACPEHIDPSADGLELCAEHLRSLLPPEFQDASFIWQVTASFGLAPLKGTGEYGATLRFRLWFILDSPQDDETLRAWAQALNAAAGYKRVDPALYCPNQPIYTAAPVFEGCQDPVPCRIGLIYGERDTVAFVPRRRPETADSGDYAGAAAGGGLGIGFEGWLSRIGDHPGGEGFHSPIIRAIAAWAAGLDSDSAKAQRSALKAKIREAIDAATKGPHRAADSARYKSDRYLDPAISGAIAKFARRPAPLEPTREFVGPPEPAEPELSDDERNFKKDLKILAGCIPRHVLPVAKRIVSRYIRCTPRKLTLAELLGQIREYFIGTERDFAQVKQFAHWLERQLKRDALEAVSIDRAKLRQYPNVRIIDRTSLDGLDAEIVAESRTEKRPIYLIKAPKGSGKTRRVLKPVAYAPEFGDVAKLVLVHTQSLVADLCCKLGLVNYQDIKRPADLEATRELGACINSLLNPKLAPFVSETGVLMVDEVSQVVRAILNPAGTMAKAARGGKKAPGPDRIWGWLMGLMDRAPCVVAADADLNTATVEALAQAHPTREIRVIVVPEDCSQISIDHATRNAVWGAVLAALGIGKRVLICTDSAKEAQKLAAWTEAHYPDRRVMCIHSQKGTATTGRPVVQALLANINENIKAVDVLIYSPSIASGVSLEVGHFDAHFGFFYGAVTPSDYIQMLRRDRTAKHFTIALCGNGASGRETDPLKLLENLDTVHRQGAEVYRDETGRLIRREVISPFDELVAKSQALENQARNNSMNGWLYLLDAQGYRVSRMGAPIPVHPTVLSEAAQLQECAYNGALRDGERIDAERREELRQQYQLTPEESAAAAAYDARQCLGLNPEEDLTPEYLALYDQGELAPKARRYDALRRPIAAAADTEQAESDAAMPLSMRRHRLSEAEALHHVFETLGLDRGTGGGELNKESVLEAFENLKASAVAPALAHFGLLHFGRRPARPISWISNFLDKLGLGLDCLKQTGGDGNRERVYAIDPERWRVMDALHRRRTHSSEGTHSSGYINIYTPATVRCPGDHQEAA